MRLATTGAGDAVNLASRLEGATKIFGVPILLDEGTRTAAGKAIAVRPVDVLHVKGRQQGVPGYELVGLPAPWRRLGGRCWRRGSPPSRPTRSPSCSAATSFGRWSGPGSRST
jgi:hypothetical protein